MPARTDRRERAADAAIEVIAAEGLSGLTHRAVDARSGLPPGSTSSCYRTRAALLAAVLRRMIDHDRELLDRLPLTGWSLATPRQRARIVAMLTDLLTYWLGPARSRTLARLELYLDATRRSEIASELAAANRHYLQRVSAGMADVGLADPDEAARLLIAQLDGLLYDALVRPQLGGADRLRESVEVIVDGFSAGRPSHSRSG